MVVYFTPGNIRCFRGSRIFTPVKEKKCDDRSFYATCNIFIDVLFHGLALACGKYIIENHQIDPYYRSLLFRNQGEWKTGTRYSVHP